ncbi:LacI family DNA-binding transcriptional regulator [Acetobacteraceae bacterium KSS8]|uniref:LacI family DNA-binding transcriptional regulator n=1 Tax=Endosaccharibacter trunci TaxID=2812733 RepID=A0ABT1W3K1_9PROT|nr:LacI family DNA-binding transcriptional regulator [Acetobacteraceae bacterium KSS8]
MGKVTVFEVAAQAGVSLATVDRVLNGRKGVRQVTIDRVQAAVERLGFRRDPFAAALATKRVERLLFILPDARTNSFMRALHEAVSAAAGPMAEQRVSIETQDYPAFDDAALARTLSAVDPQHCHGVAVVGTESPAVRREIDLLAERGVAVVTLVSDVSPSRRAQFLGIDNTAAGRVAASLIGRMSPAQPGAVALLVGRMTLHDHAERRLGFEQVLRREFPHLTLLPTAETLDDSAVSEPLMRGILAERPDLVAIYSAGAGNRGIIAALRADGRLPAPVVVAHELSAHARDALLSGIFTAVLHQDQEQEIEDAISALRSLAHGVPGRPTKPMRLQIFLRDNVP